MPRFSTATTHLGDQTVIELADSAGRRARIARHGAALLNLETVRRGAPFDVAWGYRSAAEIVARAGSHFAIMAPFGGRIADARYTFDGKAFDLDPGTAGAARSARHGFVRDADFGIEALTADANAARATLTTQAIRPRPGYPFAIDLAIVFTLDAGGLTLEARMHNVGDAPAPCFFGWHAYFRVGRGNTDGWNLQIPAQTTLKTDANLIALPGQAAYVPLDSAPELDFRQPRRVGACVLDNGYAGLRADADGRIRTHLADPVTGLALAVWQERGVMHAFTGDTLATGARSAIALEPMECMADAFNRDECAAAIRLEPGAERIFTCGVDLPAA